MKKLRIIALLLLLSLTVSISASAVDISAVGGYAMDCDTGEVFFEKNADTLLVPASMTKVMTLYLLFEKLASGEYTKNTLVPISPNAEKEASRAGYTNIPLKAGTSVPLDTLINGIVIVSACGASTAVAEFMAGSETEFVKLMNQKAQELNINASFADASGISNYNQITPSGLARLVQSFIQKYPDILNYTKKPSVTINGKTYTSTNLLLGGSGGYFYSGADGFKTGTTNKAGKCIISTAVRYGHRVISVIMNAPSNADRYKDSITLLDHSFSRYEYRDLSLYSTDARAYIEGYEIPCCYYLGQSKVLCIIAENLNSFGFDTNYDAQSSTLYIYDNPLKEIYTMVPGDDEPMTPIYKINKESAIKVILVKNGSEYMLKQVYPLNGMCAVSFEELGNYYSYSWNESVKKAVIN